MLEKLCKDCDNKECSRRTPVGGCHEMTLEEAHKLLLLETDWDWEKFRREAAKDMLANMLACPTTMNLGDKAIKTVIDYVSCAIVIADELIKQLREEKK